MNKGKICVSVCAETAGEFIEQIKRAAELADVIEIRFDCLNENEFDSGLQKISALKFKKPFLATFRPKHKLAIVIPFGLVIYEDEKQKEIVAKALEYRFDGWEKIFDLENVRFLDFEEDLLAFLTIPSGDTPFALDCFSEAGEKKALKRRIIFSEHVFDLKEINLKNYSELGEHLAGSYEFMLKKEYESLLPENEKRNDIVKIAVQVNDISDSIPIWKLLEKAKSENKQIIPIAMGEAGKWTRILGLAHGAFMTYAALETGSETAPGQISARDLIEVYRIKELNERTEIYGIIGGNTSYSMSPYIHNAAFKFHHLNAVFVPLQVQDLDAFMRRMVKPETREIELNFRGFAVTIPHKQNIVGHLDFIDETAREIGAVNTVKIDADGKISGYNTDAPGFFEPLRNSFGGLQNARVAVVGAGGASRAVCYSLKKAGADVTVYARNPAKAEQLKADFGVKIEEFSTAKSYRGFDVLVNATPLGTKGEMENETPAFASQLEKLKLVYDLIYNPFETKLIKEAKKVSVPVLGGLSMLVAQAAAQQKIWTSTDAPVEEMSAAAVRRLTAK